MDNLDSAIIHYLTKNARASYKEIGEEIGLTAPAVANRVQKLENDGVIKGYSIRVDHAKIGLDIKALIMVRIGDSKYTYNDFIKVVSEMEEVLLIYRLTGEYCIAMRAQFRDNAHMVSFIDTIYKYGNTETSIILDEIIKTN
ncbi:MAG: Lrp/AsnC family transcriptional regulator [Bacteroidota bacterium]